MHQIYPVQMSEQTAGLSTRLADPLLLVEDDDEIRAVLVECLEDNGFHVVEAPDAEHAQSLLAKGLQPPLIVTDINLGPGESGLMLADLVHHDHPRTPVVFITGRLDMLRDRGLKPMEYIVPKPFPLSALMNVVRRFMPGPGGCRIIPTS